jgi:hypothetical protein
MSIGGTIRCPHGCILDKEEDAGLVVHLSSSRPKPDSCTNKCMITLPKEALNNIKKGMNATSIFFHERIDLNKFLKDNEHTFRYVGHSSGFLTPYGLIHLVY